MLDRYDPRSDDGRNRGDSWDRSFGSRGCVGERDRDEHSRDVFTRDLDLPRGRDVGAATANRTTQLRGAATSYTGGGDCAG